MELGGLKNVDGLVTSDRIMSANVISCEKDNVDVVGTIFCFFM